MKMFKLGREVKISPSGQFSISIEAVAKLPSFKKDVETLKRIRKLLQTRDCYKSIRTDG